MFTPGLMTGLNFNNPQFVRTKNILYHGRDGIPSFPTGYGLFLSLLDLLVYKIPEFKSQSYVGAGYCLKIFCIGLLPTAATTTVAPVKSSCRSMWSQMFLTMGTSCSKEGKKRRELVKLS